MHTLIVKIGAESFAARLQSELAPHSCECVMGLLPYSGPLIHACWSGEALWSPLREALPPELVLPPESCRHQPARGEIVLFVGERSEPELLIVYGTSRFACKSGALEGNPLLRIENRLDRLTDLGRDVLWGGATTLQIEAMP